MTLLYAPPLLARVFCSLFIGECSRAGFPALLAAFQAVKSPQGHSGMIFSLRGCSASTASLEE